MTNNLNTFPRSEDGKYAILPVEIKIDPSTLTPDGNFDLVLDNVREQDTNTLTSAYFFNMIETHKKNISQCDHK